MFYQKTRINWEPNALPGESLMFFVSNARSMLKLNCLLNFYSRARKMVLWGRDRTFLLWEYFHRKAL